GAGSIPASREPGPVPVGATGSALHRSVVVREIAASAFADRPAPASCHWPTGQAPWLPHSSRRPARGRARWRWLAPAEWAGAAKRNSSTSRLLPHYATDRAELIREQ